MQSIRNDKCSHLMFKLSSTCSNTRSKSLSPLFNGFINYVLIQLVPFLSNLTIFKEYLKVKWVNVSRVSSQISAEQFGISIIEIDPQGKMLLQKYKGIPILWNTCVLSATFYVTAIILRYTKNIYIICNCKPHLLKANFLTNTSV